jgi:acetolactate decarboxylase
MAIDEQLIGALHLTRSRAGDVTPAEPGHEVFQASTIAALLDGAYDGDVSFDELAGHGDQGLGTLDACDGEMIAIDGRFLRADVDGAISEIPGGTRTPFAVLSFFRPAHRFELEGPLAQEELLAEIDRRVGHPEMVHAVRIDGRFDLVHCRSVPAQRKPYRPLAEVVAGQHVFDFADAEGTLVGFRFPGSEGGVAVPGYHLHFVTSDRTRGGHVLDFCAGTVAVAVDDSSELRVETPPGVEIGGAEPDAGDVARIEHENAPGR